MSQATTWMNLTDGTWGKTRQTYVSIYVKFKNRQNLSGVGHITKNVAVSGWVGIDCEGT